MAIIIENAADGECKINCVKFYFNVWNPTPGEGGAALAPRSIFAISAGHQI